MFKSFWPSVTKVCSVWPRSAHTSVRSCPGSGLSLGLRGLAQCLAIGLFALGQSLFSLAQGNQSLFKIAQGLALGCSVWARVRPWVSLVWTIVWTRVCSVWPRVTKIYSSWFRVWPKLCLV